MIQPFDTLRHGLVGAWCPSLEPRKLSALGDISPRKNDGTFTNMVMPSSYVVSQGGYALNFNGSNSRVQLKQLVTTNVFTFSCWKYPRANHTASGGGLFYQGSGAVSPGTHVSHDSDYPTGFRWEGGELKFATSESPLNRWSHIAVTFDRGNGSFWLNGLPNGTFTGAGSSNPSANSSYFGAWYDFSDSTRFFDGLLDDVRVYDRALTRLEVALLASRRGIGLRPQRQRRYRKIGNQWFIRIGGDWKPAESLVNVAGTWKTAEGFIKVGGAWR